MQSQFSQTRDSKGFAVISQMARAFGMNLKVVGSSPTQVQTFSVSKRWHFHKNIRRVLKLNAVNRAQLTFLMFTWFKKKQLLLSLSLLLLLSLLALFSTVSHDGIALVQKWISCAKCNFLYSYNVMYWGEALCCVTRWYGNAYLIPAMLFCIWRW